MVERRQFGEAKFWVHRGGPDEPAKAVFRVWGTTFDVFDAVSADWRAATPAEMQATETLFRDGSLAAVPEMMAAMAQAILWGEAHPEVAEAIRSDGARAATAEEEPAPAPASSLFALPRDARFAQLPPQPDPRSQPDAPVFEDSLKYRRFDPSWAKGTDEVYATAVSRLEPDPWPDRLPPTSRIIPLGHWDHSWDGGDVWDGSKGGRWVVALWLTDDAVLQVGPGGHAVAWLMRRLTPWYMSGEGDMGFGWTYRGSPEEISFQPVERWQDTAAFTRMLDDRWRVAHSD